MTEPADASPPPDDRPARSARPPVSRRPVSRRPVSWRARAVAILAGCVLAFGVLEISLRILDPLPLRIRGDRIDLPIDRTIRVDNTRIPKIDREITIRRNHLGFRGDEPPADFDRRLTIVTVGGSTTECFYLSEGHTWPDRLARRLETSFDRVWLNNAGLDGHSTYGHRLLLTEYLAPLHPKVIVYLVGLNDVSSRAPTPFDDRLGPGDDALMRGLWRSAVGGSATLQYVDAWLRSRAAARRGVVHGSVDHDQLMLRGREAPQLDPELARRTLEEHRTEYLPSYERRLRDLIRATRERDIRAVLVTQPALYGPTVDDVTGVDLGTMRVDDTFDGALKWQVLELYNDVTRRVATEERVPLIDLAGRLSKSSRWYYDLHHFTDEGAREVARIVDEGLADFLRREFPEFARPTP